MSLLRQVIIEITREAGTRVGKIHTLGPYERDDSRRTAYWELRGEGREVYALNTYSDGSVYERPYFREER